jgi:hypothetical protein
MPSNVFVGNIARDSQVRAAAVLFVPSLFLIVSVSFPSLRMWRGCSQNMVTLSLARLRTDMALWSVYAEILMVLDWLILR